MNVTVDELRSYYDALSRHEWTFDFSDDCRVWDKGRCELDYLQGMTTKNSRFAELFRDFSNYVWGSAPNDGWAVVSRTYLDPQQGILHFDGTQWAEIASDPVTAPANFQAIWGIGGEIWAVGGPGSSSAGNAFLIWHRGS